MGLSQHGCMCSKRIPLIFNDYYLIIKSRENKMSLECEELKQKLQELEINNEE